MQAIPKFSVVILTYNEESSIEGCLQSCYRCDDVHVLDSGSVDRTVEIAQKLGASVHSNPFKSFGQQRNWAIDNIACKYDWVFHLDADEHLTEPLIAEIADILKTPQAETKAGFFVPHKLMLHQRWLKRSGGYPVYQMRFFHKGRTRFVDHGHGQREEAGLDIGRLGEPYLHFAFCKGMEAWLAKHNRYAKQEAELLLESGATFRYRDLLSRDSLLRRRAWKSLSFKFPCRPVLRWWVVFVFQLGFLDGPSGLTYAKMMSTYEQMFELHRRALAERNDA